MSENWHSLMNEADFPAEGKHAAIVDGWHVLIAKTGDGYAAVNDRCTHMASLLSTGKVRRGTVFCPVHGARFDLASGRCAGGAYKDLRVFPIRVDAGVIMVAIPAEPPRADELPNLAI